MKFIAACVQLNSGNNMNANIQTASNLIKEAIAQGADFISLPENAIFMSATPEELFANAYFTEEHPALKAFSELAKQYGKWLLIGSIAVKLNNETKLANRSILINPEGKIAAHYDKIHLFDSNITGGETHKESDRFIAGFEPVTTQTPWGKIGMTICYDVRFPQLHRHLAKNGAGVITAPAAFTYFTGKPHWHVLLRARAIETGSYIIAAAQTGFHPSGRQTYGHSLIIDPWGEVLCDAGEDVRIVTAEIDMEKVTFTRKQMPSLEHDRMF